MRDVDERVAAVRGRVRRMKRKRDRAAMGALATCALALVAILVGMPLMGERITIAPAGSTLFGASSLFGPSIGGYVIVALVAAVAAVLITVFCVTRRKKDDAPVDDERNSR